MVSGVKILGSITSASAIVCSILNKVIFKDKNPLKEIFILQHFHYMGVKLFYCGGILIQFIFEKGDII